ncbi:hypothetical protein POM88_009980 [Heracleum sosnowskyi]|uniref:Uncharacterized protein n=1 Tax=Heracleum sosnowskyi TaxID=360622 RepID=A0AAD8J9A5_9APIA|nr:hypothetical protein POM88_009980 [Heracleum sosnowskyi]
MVHTRFSSSPSSSSKSDMPPKQKKIKKSKAPLKAKRVRPAIDDPVSVDEVSPSSTSKTVMSSKRKTTKKSKASVKDKRPNLAIYNDPIPIDENGSTLDPLSHLNQAATNVGDWDPWPQSTQNVSDKDLQIGHVDEDVEDAGENLEDAFDNVVVGNEFGNEVGNEVGNQVAEGGHEVSEDGTCVSKVVVEDSEDATMFEKESIDLDRTVKMAGMITDDNDDGVHNEKVTMEMSVGNYWHEGTSALTPQDKVTPAVAKRSFKFSAYLKSPYMRYFGSSSGKSGEGLQNLKGVSALDDNIGQLPSLKISTGFTSWLDHGMNTKKKYVFLFVISVQAPQGHLS